jgi:hypothetical protein
MQIDVKKSRRETNINNIHDRLYYLNHPHKFSM